MCVYTFEKVVLVAWCFFFFFSFTMSNSVVVEKHLGFGYLLIVLHSFFFLQLHLL